MTVPHQADRADLLWRIHRHFAESKLTSFCLDARWEISPWVGIFGWISRFPPGSSWHRTLGHHPGLLTFPFPKPPPALPFVQLHFSMWFPFLQFLKYSTVLVNIWIFFFFSEFKLLCFSKIYLLSRAEIKDHVKKILLAPAYILSR